MQAQNGGIVLRVPLKQVSRHALVYPVDHTDEDRLFVGPHPKGVFDGQNVLFGQQEAGAEEAFAILVAPEADDEIVDRHRITPLSSTWR